MNTCCELHFPDDLFEQYTLGMVSNQDSRLLEEHLLLCVACQRRLMKVEEFILILRSALAELGVHPQSEKIGAGTDSLITAAVR
jgi:hypothetical protein